MGIAAQIKDEIDSLVLARIRGGAIESYTLADGRKVERTRLEKIFKVREGYAAEAQIDADGSSISIFRWSSDPGTPQ